MKIYTKEEYLKIYTTSPTYMDEMVVFQDDLDLIKHQDPKNLPTYLTNIEMSIKNLMNNSVPTVKWKNKKERISFLKQPFVLYNMLDAGGTHHRFSIQPYHKNIREKYDLKTNSLSPSHTIETKFVKHNYNDDSPVMNCLLVYKSYVQKLILESTLEVKATKRLSTKKL